MKDIPERCSDSVPGVPSQAWCIFLSTYVPSSVLLDPLLVLHFSPHERDDNNTTTDPFLSNADKRKRKRRNISKRYQPDWESRCDNAQSFNDRSGQVLDQSYGKECNLARPSWGYTTVTCTRYCTEHSWSGTESGVFTTADTVWIPINHIQIFKKKNNYNKQELFLHYNSIAHTMKNRCFMESSWQGKTVPVQLQCKNC